VQVGALSNWAKVNAADTSSRAIKTNGTLWAWGSNEFGELGTGNTTRVSSPVQVGALSNWVSISAFRHVLALVN
jgi:alpha-tubulin suppressor-like RCC1 family protein